MVVNGCGSDWTSVTSGVPQGTVLGPILFDLFVNAIVDVVSPGSEIRLFADDCICYRKVRSMQDCETPQQDIDRLALWADTWLMDFAPTECKTMRIPTKTRNNIPYLYHPKGVALDSVKEVRHLGITINHNLRWNRHIADTTRRANQILGLLRRNLYFCDQKTKEAVYVDLVRPILEYACAIGDPYQQNLTQELEKVQRRFVTSDYSDYEEGAITGHMRSLGWKDLKSRREAATTCLFNQGLNSLENLPLHNLSQPQRQSRHMHDKHLNIPYARTNIYKFSFLPKAIKLWNSLPNALILDSKNVVAFEVNIKET